MRDVSGILDHYRVSARGIWNTAFWPDADFRNWDSVDRFDEIQRILFSELVLAKLGKEWPIDDVFRTPIPFLQVVPSHTIPIMIQNPRPDRPIGYWDHPLNRISPGEAEMNFLGYFDWNRLDYVDFRYYHVKIARFDAKSELVGREALIDRLRHASVYLVEE
jgi:hypothetical protein